MAKPLRVAGIIICCLLLAAPAIVCFRGASPHMMEVVRTISLLFPVTFWALSRIFIAEGREQERAERERADQERHN